MKLLIKTEFKRNLKSLLLWLTIVLVLAVLMLSLFTAFDGSFDMINEYLEVFPEGFLKVFGMGPGGLDMTEAYGWYGMEGYLFVVLIGGCYAGILGSSVLSKEEDDKTIEFLLSKPISRNKILLSKGLVVLINLFLFNLLMFIALTITFSIVAEYEFITVLMLCFGPLVLQAIFAYLAMLISVFVTKSRMVMSASLGLVLGLYFLDVIVKLYDELNFLKYISPYEFVNAVDIVNNNLIDPIYLIISLGMILFSILATWFFYNRKDITV